MNVKLLASDSNMILFDRAGVPTVAAPADPADPPAAYAFLRKILARSPNTFLDLEASVGLGLHSRVQKA